MHNDPALELRRLLHAQRPGLYAMPPLKAALVAAMGTEGAARAYGEQGGFAPGFAPDHLPCRGLRDHALTQAWEFDRMVASRRLHLPAPQVFGREPGAGLDVATRDFFFCEVPDALVSSKSNIVLTKDVALLDVQDAELDKAPVDLRVDPVVVDDDHGKLTVLRAAAPMPTLDRAFHLTGIHSFAFGHWILEFLPKVWACRDRPGFGSVPILVDERMPRQHREALAFFLGDDHPLITLAPTEARTVRRLWTCSMITYMPHGSRPAATVEPDATTLDAPAFAGLIRNYEEKLQCLPRHANGGTRLYLARRQTQHRRLVNDADVQEWVIANGFRVVDFTDMPFLEQLSLVRDADIILGPHGSAFMMAFFARAGTRIGILNNAHLVDFEWYTDVFRALRMPHGILVGDTVREDRNYGFFSDYRIDPDRLGPFLESL